MGPITAISRRERLVTRAFFALMAVVYVALFPYFRFLNNPNEHTRTFLTMALVEEGTFAITTQIRRYGTTNDLAARTDEVTRQTGFYGVKAPLVSYLGVPVYAGFRLLTPVLGLPLPEETINPVEHTLYLEHVTHVLRFFCVQLPCLAFLVLFERFLRRRSRDLSLRLAAVVAVGLGTNYLAYALSFTSHALFACAAFGSFALTTLERERIPSARRPKRAFVAALAASACTLLEYHGAGVTLMLGLYVVLTFRRPLSVFLAALAASLCAAGMLVYQWKSFGDPLTPGHKLQVNPAFAAHHAEGVNGVSLPDLDALGSIAFDKAIGCFTSSPFLGLGLLAIPFGLFFVPSTTPKPGRERITQAMWLFTMLGLFLLVSGVHNWHGGWSIGPRYLGAAPPFFAFGAVCAAESFAGTSRLRRAIVRAVSLGCATASVIALGSVGLLVNTLPEEIKRPFVQFAIPMLRAGFVPHHVLELVGVQSGVPVYVVAACGVACLLIAYVASFESRAGARWAIVPLAIGVAFVTLIPLRMPNEAYEEENAKRAVALYARNWNPEGRDRITRVRAALVRDGHGGCGFHALADLETSVGLLEEAALSRSRARIPRARCPSDAP